METPAHNEPEGFATEQSAAECLERSGWIFDRVCLVFGDMVYRHPDNRKTTETRIQKNHDGRFIYFA